MPGHAFNRRLVLGRGPGSNCQKRAIAMNRPTRHLCREEGFALVYMAALLTGLLLFTGLAVDSGRAYVVKAQLSKAVDGAALGAARNINGGNPSGTAAMII